MLYKTDKMSEMVLEFLNKSEGYLIEHNGFDEVLLMLGDIFDYKLPSKENFISDAEKRYRMLSDSIDAFTERASANKKVNREENDTADGKVNEVSEVKQAIKHITSETELQNLFREGLALVNAGKDQEAVKSFKNLVEKDPQNARYHFWLGFVLHGMENYERAENEMRRAVDLEPETALYHVIHGEILQGMDCYVEALQEMEKAVELEPDNKFYRDSLERMLQQ